MNLKISKLTQEVLERRMDDFISLESHWTSSGETLWEEENFRRELPGKFDVSVYATLDEKVIGYAIGSLEDKTAKLNKIMNHTDYRGRGIGTSIWNDFLQKCREQEVDKIDFKVLLDNYSAIKIYDKAGCMFNGISKGTDDKDRLNVSYILKASKQISHSKPSIKQESIDAVVDSIKNGNLATGNEVENLINVLGGEVEKQYGVATNSGSNALFISLRALDVKQGDQVILPTYLCGSVLHAVENTGASPVFADNEQGSSSVSVKDVERRVNDKTKAIIIPHLFGKSVSDIKSLTSSGVPIIEDCAQSLGAKYGGVNSGFTGDVAIYSFYPTKVIPSFSGGVALTNDKEISEGMNDLINTDNRVDWGEAYSVKMREADAVLALYEHKGLQENISRRREIARQYDEKIPNEFVKPNYDDNNIYFRYVVSHGDSQNIINNLRGRNIDATKPIYQPLHRYKSISDNEFPNASQYHNDSISIPIYPALKDEQVSEIIGAMRNRRNENEV